MRSKRSRTALQQANHEGASAYVHETKPIDPQTSTNITTDRNIRDPTPVIAVVESLQIKRAGVHSVFGRVRLFVRSRLVCNAIQVCELMCEWVSCFFCEYHRLSGYVVQHFDKPRVSTICL